MHPPLVLELPVGRARLEPLTAAHAERLFAAVDDEGCWRYQAWPRPRSAKDMGAYIEAALRAARAGTDHPFAIIDRETGGPVGTTRYCDIQPTNRHVEIGWTMLGPGVQRTSVNTECKYLLFRHAFEAYDFGPGRMHGCIRVTLKCDARNERSRRAIERVGGVREGVLRKHRVMPDGFMRDSVYYSVLAEEWPAVKERLEGLLRKAR